MLRNFVTDSYLERYYGDIINYRQGSRVDYSEVISLGFEILLDDLSNRDIDPRLCMIPIDLNRNASSVNIQQLLSSTVSSTTNGYAWEGKYQRRLVINLTSKTVLTDDWSFILQGSNKLSRPDDVDTTWETVSTISYDLNTLAADIVEENQTFSTMYKWYRLRTVKNSGSGSVTFTASIWETVFDSLIVFKTIGLIAQSWKTGLSPKWDDMRDSMEKEYDNKIQSIKFTYDEDQNGIPKVYDESRKSNVRITR